MILKLLLRSTAIVQVFLVSVIISFNSYSQEGNTAQLRKLNVDNWVATDALGRELPGYDSCGPLKDDRYVGMFYFMTHNKPGGNGPFDVTKIMQENPENPQWGDGAHYWGEPETGYYLSSEKWMLARHARLLSDAGVDVIIFDVTNDKTYANVYIPVCEVFTELRKKGEHTPSVAFLGSEISVNVLWDDFYNLSSIKIRELRFH